MKSTYSVAPPEEPAIPRIPIGRFLERFGLVVAWLIVIGIFGVLEPSTFLTVQTLGTMLSSQSVIVFLTLALVLPMTTGDFDLSAAAVLTLSSMVVAVLNVQHGWPIGAAVGVAILASAVVGVVNGALVVFIGIDSFIVTLGTGSVVTGIVIWISNLNTISGVSQTLINLVVIPRVLSLGLGFFYGVMLCALLWYVLEYTAFGRRLLFVGQGRRVARLSGLGVGRERLLALVCSSSIAGLAGVIYVGTTSAADPSSGLDFLLPAFAAAFLGSTTIIPGRFNPVGSLIAVYFLVTGITGLSLLGVQVFIQNVFYGGALIIAVALSQLARRHRVGLEE